MEASMFTGFADMELDDDLSLFDNLVQVNSMEEIFGAALVVPEQETNSSQSDHNRIVIEEKQQKTNNWMNSFKIIDHAILSNSQLDGSNLNMLSFAKSSNYDSQNGQQVPRAPQIKAKESSTLSSLSQQSKDHILAERKRREKLNQRFIALTAIIPGLKKMDKASILGEAINYVKQLEAQVKTLEEQTKTKVIESVVFVKRSRVSEEDEEDELDHFSNNGAFENGALPEVEAIFYNKDVVIKIHCEKKNGVVEKLISYIENMHLVVINTSTLGFGCASLHATIVAQVTMQFFLSASPMARNVILEIAFDRRPPIFELKLHTGFNSYPGPVNIFKMDAEFSMTTKDLVRHLHAALKRLMG